MTTTEDKLIERLVEEARKSTRLERDLAVAGAQAVEARGLADRAAKAADDCSIRLTDSRIAIELIRQDRAEAEPRLFELHEAATALLAMASSSKPRRGDVYKQAQERLRTALQRAHGDCGLIPF